MALVVLGALAFILFNSGKSSSNVVVVDLGRVHRDLGREGALMEELQKEQVALNTKVEELRAGLETKISTMKEKIGDSPNDEQQKELNRLEQEMAMEIKLQTENNRQLLDNRSRESFAKFLQEVRPVALKIAAKRRATIVLNLHPDRIITADPSADITSEVVEALKQSLPLPADGNP